MIRVLWMVEVLVGRLFLLLKYFTFAAEEEMKQYRRSSGAAVYAYEQSDRHDAWSVFY